MKIQRLKRIMAMILSTAMVMTGMGVNALAKPVEEETTGTAEHTIYIVGDSTACDYIKEDGTHTDASYYYPRYGYGTQFKEYFDTEHFAISNLALSGRSSKSFLEEGNYNTLKNNIKAGDVLVIGFGHNDEKTETARYTNPNGDYTTEGSFAKNLYDNYVKLATDKGATPILCTPICRRNDSGVLTNSDKHITTGNSEFPGGDYAKAIRDLAATKNITLVDLTAITASHYASISANGTLYMHAWQSDNLEGKDEASLKMKAVPTADNTHLNIFGAKWVAYQFAKAIASTEIDLAEHVKAGIVEPTKENDLEANSAYKHTFYNAPTSWSKVYRDYTAPNGVVFHGTIMGKSVNANNATLTTDKNGNVCMQSTSEKGKIASNEDSFLFYFAQVPSDAEFTFTAKATLNSWGTASAKQNAFGLMARDDVWVDGTGTESTADYVVAGTLGEGAICNSFKRQSSALGGYGSIGSVTVAPGNTYDLKMTKNPDGFACSFAGLPEQTGGFDFQLATVDSEYMYVGMMVARTVDVTFSDVELKVKCNAKHTVSDVITKAPTCKETGLKDIKCIWCGEGATATNVTVDKLSHDFKYETTKEADCGNDGLQVKKCSMCGEVDTEAETKVIPAAGEHSWNEGVITTPATALAEGVKTITCTTCGATKTESVSKLQNDDTVVNSEVIQNQNSKRDEVATTGGTAEVKQADDDNTVVNQEITNKGKTKTLEIVALGEDGNTSKERVDYYVTVNAGTKYLIKNGEYKVVTANNGSETDNAKDIKKIAACKAKNGNTTLTVKALKNVGTYGATLYDEEQNAYVHLAIQNLKLPKVTEVSALCGKEIAFTTVEDKASDIKSAEWYFGKVKIGTGAANATELVKGKKNFGKAYINPQTGNVVVTIAEGYTKGNVKLTATINKKKYNTKLKIVPAQ